MLIFSCFSCQEDEFPDVIQEVQVEDIKLEGRFLPATLVKIHSMEDFENMTPNELAIYKSENVIHSKSELDEWIRIGNQERATRNDQEIGDDGWISVDCTLEIWYKFGGFLGFIRQNKFFISFQYKAVYSDDLDNQSGYDITIRDNTIEATKLTKGLGKSKWTQSKKGRVSPKTLMPSGKVKTVISGTVEWDTNFILDKFKSQIQDDNSIKFDLIIDPSSDAWDNGRVLEIQNFKVDNKKRELTVPKKSSARQFIETIDFGNGPGGLFFASNAVTSYFIVFGGAPQPAPPYIPPPPTEEKPCKGKGCREA